MSFVAPWMLAVGALATVGVVLLHLLSTRRPPLLELPTARFVPESDVRAVARTSKPTDLLLLLLRALSLLLIAAGFAQPIPDAPGPALRTVVALEWTTALTDAEAARAEAQRRLGEGDALVVFDTAARAIDARALAELPPPTVRRASLSPMYVAARDAAREIARGADSLRLVVVSAFSADALDAATPAFRAAWAGRAEYQRLSAVADTASATQPTLLPADVNDPLAPALRIVSARRGAQALRVRRDSVAASADSAWLSAERDAVLILWPRRSADSLRADAVTMLDFPAATLAAPLTRGAVPEGRVLARWRDGSPAVTERSFGLGCVRHVGVGIPDAGDLTLRTPFGDFLEGLLAPCGGRREVALADSALSSALDEGPLASAASFINDGRERSPLTPWLLAAGVLLLIAEQLLRARTRTEVA